MVNFDRSEDRIFVRELRAEATANTQRFMNWLGLASAGGAVALLSFAANLPDPDLALRVFLPALTAFAVGSTTAGVAIFSAAQRMQTIADHLAATHNRDELADALDRTPTVVSAPKKIAEEANRPREKLVAQHDEFHREATAYWKQHRRWKLLHRGYMTLSFASFLAGVGIPLVQVALGTPFSPSI